MNKNMKKAIGRSTLSAMLALGATSALMAAGLTFISASPAMATGTTTNTITASKAPAAGSVGGSYTPVASATSGDQVVITLDHTSKGCSISGGKVSFTAPSGTCRVDFNDAGNSTYAAAIQVQQSIKVYPANTITASKAPAAGSVGGSYTPSASATSGDKVVITLDGTSSGCSINAGKVSFIGTGTCRVDFNDVGNGAFAAAIQVQQSITVSATGQKTQTTLTLTSISGVAGTSLTLTSKGGSGTGAVSYAVTNVGSAGCAISGTALSATKAGTCTVTVTKAGDTTYLVAHSSATTVTFTVSPTGHTTQATLTLTSTSGVAGTSLTLTSKGGSGTGAVSYAVTNVGTAECAVYGTALLANKAGTCTVTVTKASDTTYLVAHSSATTVTFTGHSVTTPKAIRMGSAVWTGRSVITTIIGAGFYGQPRIISNVSGTRVGVLHDTGHVLTIRVTVAATAPRGVHTFTIVFLHGERTTVRYNQR
jgi:hypothetical protein